MARSNGIEESDVAKQLDVLKQDIAGLNDLMSRLTAERTEDAKDRARGLAADAGAAVTDMAEDARRKAAETGAQVRAQAGLAYGTAEEAVRRQPALAMGMAAGVGFLVGLMMTRRG